MAFVQRVDITPEKPEGAAQHVALFKNVLIAADGGKSAKLHVFDVRDWKVKQVIRVGEVSEAVTGDSSGSGGPAPASVSSLAFDGMTIAVGTHQGYVHTWKLMEHEGKRGYVRLLNPLKAGVLVPSSSRTLVRIRSTQEKKEAPERARRTHAVV